MAKIHKVYPPFFNGVSQQNPEMVLDSQCKEMVNCIPDLVQGLTRRPPVLHQKTRTDLMGASIFHTYDRGEDEEEYIFLETGDYDEPIKVFSLDGTEMVVNINTDNSALIKDYLANGNLKGLTVQDRTWVLSKNASVSVDTSTTSALDADYDKVAYYWLKRGSGDRYNPYNYAVYLDGNTFACNPNKPGTDVQDPPTGFEDSTYAAEYLQGLIDETNAYSCSVSGSLLKIWKTDGTDFTFSSWDSWGNQASEGWKGSVNKVTDLPKDMPFSGVYVQITGDEVNSFTDYYVKWNGSSWEECLNPTENRGVLTNMPLKMDRVSLINGTAIFEIDIIEWTQPNVGNIDNNPDPSFVGTAIVDLFFHKNRLGIASSDSIVMSENALYTNFYIQTALDVLDTDPIDVTIASSQASKIYYVKPFNNSLYAFTQDTQYDLTYEGALSPNTVSLNVATNYSMSVDVEPMVINDSLYFISTTGSRQQLREYIKTETLSVKGVDLNVSTPTYLEDPIVSLRTDGSLGIVLCCTANNKVYVYKYVEDGQQRVQSAWSTWTFFEGLDYTADSFEYYKIGNSLIITLKTDTYYSYHLLFLDTNYNQKIFPDGRQDRAYDPDSPFVPKAYPYESLVVLPDFYPKFKTLRNPKDKVQIKKIIIEGEGTFDAELYNKAFDKTYSKSKDYSLKDLDFHILSKVGDIEVTIKDSSEDDFKVSSIILEGLFRKSSKELE